MGMFIRRPRLLRKPRIIPRSVGVGPVRVSKRAVYVGPFGWWRKRRR